MKTLITILQAGSGFFLIIAILLQQRGTGLSMTFGGEGNIYRTKRGVEKILFYFTILLAFLFFASSLGSVFIKG